VLAITPQQLWRSTAARPVLGRLRPSAGRPYRRLWHDAGYIAQSERRDVRTQIGVGAIAGTPRSRPAAHARRNCSSAIAGLVLKVTSLGTPALRDVYGPSPTPSADRGDTPPASSRDDWQLKVSRRSDNCLACQPRRNVDARPRRNAVPKAVSPGPRARSHQTLDICREPRSGIADFWQTHLTAPLAEK
jgi:hypothetical protein